MKTLTDTQKKWFLTGTLASLLSLNLVMSLAGHGVQANTADFASTAVVKEVVTADGVVRPVLLSPENGETNKTRAVVYPAGAETPKLEAAVTAAGNCVGCKTLLVNRALNTDEKNSNVNQILGAVLKAADAPPQEPEAPIEAVSTAAPRTRTATRAAAPAATDSPNLRADEGRSETAPARPKRRACELVYGGCDKDENRSDSDSDYEPGSRSGTSMPSITEKCDQDGRYPANRKYFCYGKVLTNLLSSEAEASYSKSDVMRAWNKVKPKLVSALKNNAPEESERAKSLLQIMLTGVSDAKYQYLQEEVVLAATQAVADTYRQAQSFANDFKENPSTSNESARNFDAAFRKAELMRVQLNQYFTANDFGSVDAEMINKGYVKPTETIAAKIRSNNRLNYAIPEITRANVYDSDFKTVSSSSPSLRDSDSSTGAVKRATNLPNGVTTVANGLSPSKVATDNTPRISGNGGANPQARITPKGPAPGVGNPGVNGINGANNVNPAQLAPGGRGALTDPRRTLGAPNTNGFNMRPPQ